MLEKSPPFPKIFRNNNVPPKDAIFDFVSSILSRSRKCFELWNECKLVGEAVLPILSVLYNNAKAVLQVQQCHNKDVSKFTGLTSFQIFNAKKYVGKYTDDELIDMLLRIRKCEKGIKTGTIEEQYVIDYLLVSTL